MNHREKPTEESHSRFRHRFPKGDSRGCSSPPDREHIAVSLPRAPMRQRLSRRSVCLTACHSIFPSPSLTGWSAISCGCSSAGASRVQLMQAISYRALTAGVKTKKPLSPNPEWNIPCTGVRGTPHSGVGVWLKGSLRWNSTSNEANYTKKRGPTQEAGPQLYNTGEHPNEKMSITV